MIWQISIREGMKAAEQRMKELQKLIENGARIICSINFLFTLNTTALPVLPKMGAKKQ